MPYLNTQISATQRQVPSEPQTLGATEFKSAMHEMASSIVESIRESNRTINDNLQNLVSNMPPSSSQTGTKQNSQTRGRDRTRISRTSRHRRSEVRHTVNVSDSSVSDRDIGLSSTTNGSNGRNTQSHVRYDSVKLPNFTGNYETLVAELNSRFRVVETKKTFGAQFSKRNQKVSESAEEYAAELKRLYDRAYSQRDSETRQEDLLRRFLDGLYDAKARFQVEYVN